MPNCTSPYYEQLFITSSSPCHNLSWASSMGVNYILIKLYPCDRLTRSQQLLVLIQKIMWRVDLCDLAADPYLIILLLLLLYFSLHSMHQYFTLPIKIKFEQLMGMQ